MAIEFEDRINWMMKIHNKFQMVLHQKSLFSNQSKLLFHLHFDGWNWVSMRKLKAVMDIELNLYAKISGFNFNELIERLKILLRYCIPVGIKEKKSFPRGNVYSNIEMLSMVKFSMLPRQSSFVLWCRDISKNEVNFAWK